MAVYRHAVITYVRITSGLIYSHISLLRVWYCSFIFVRHMIFWVTWCSGKHKKKLAIRICCTILWVRLSFSIKYVGILRSATKRCSTLGYTDIVWKPPIVHNIQSPLIFFFFHLFMTYWIRNNNKDIMKYLLNITIKVFICSANPGSSKIKRVVEVVN